GAGGDAAAGAASAGEAGAAAEAGRELLQIDDEAGAASASLSFESPDAGPFQ
ncbi:MAG: hypothetical protein QOJ27_977, partial [Sphingomonadales bacterium]|nr:hypothetical protein [Sphingomonadales bacterium]